MASDDNLQHKGERTTKTCTGHTPSDVRKFKPKARNGREKPDRCPLIANKKLRDNIPHMCDPEFPFFLSINHVKTPKPQSPWFKNYPMGIYLIYSLVKRMKLQCPVIQNKNRYKPQCEKTPDAEV